jgi:hypothetical protein
MLQHRGLNRWHAAPRSLRPRGPRQPHAARPGDASVDAEARRAPWKPADALPRPPPDAAPLAVARGLPSHPRIEASRAASGRARSPRRDAPPGLAARREPASRGPSAGAAGGGPLARDRRATTWDAAPQSWGYPTSSAPIGKTEPPTKSAGARQVSSSETTHAVSRSAPIWGPLDLFGCDRDRPFCAHRPRRALVAVERRSPR